MGGGGGGAAVVAALATMVVAGHVGEGGFDFCLSRRRQTTKVFVATGGK